MRFWAISDKKIEILLNETVKQRNAPCSKNYLILKKIASWKSQEIYENSPALK